MTLTEAIIKVFTSNSGKWFSSQKLRIELAKELGYYPIEAEFKREFLHIRDTFQFEGKKILKFMEFGAWRYALSDNKYLVNKHDLHLKKANKRSDRRMVNK